MQKRSNECQNEAGNEQRLSSHGEARPRTSDISSEEDNRNRERGLKDDLNAVRPNAGKRRHSEDDPPSEKKKRKHAADGKDQSKFPLHCVIIFKILTLMAFNTHNVRIMHIYTHTMYIFNVI